LSKGTPNRRNLLALGAGLAAIATGWQLWVGREKPLTFEQIPGLPGWRRIAFDSVTGTGGSASDAAFIGLDASETLPLLSPQSLCATLYPKADKGIPSAIFTDVNCPNCARLEAKLKARSDVLALNWHDLPVLGPTSENAARAMSAGDLQRNGAAFRQRVLNTSPGRLKTPVLANLAEETGLNAERLLADMGSAQVDAALKQTRRAAQTLGVWGTPGFTIGRTFVLGDMRDDVLDQLIVEETGTNNAC
jgi:predicted DsbA family dithiol-disulfide isomerase